MYLTAFYSIILLVLANVFMTVAWYGHLKLSQMYQSFAQLPLIAVIVVSWGLAFFEYCLQVPANRMAYEDQGGPFNIMQLKILQEVITLVVFVVFSMFAFKLKLTFNHLMACLCLIAAVYFVFKK